MAGFGEFLHVFFNLLHGHNRKLNQAIPKVEPHSPHVQQELSEYVALWNGTNLQKSHHVTELSQLFKKSFVYIIMK